MTKFFQNKDHAAQSLIGLGACMAVFAAVMLIFFPTPHAHATSSTSTSGGNVGLCSASGPSCPAEHKVTLCHRTSSNTNPYNKVTVSVNAAGMQGGHADHKGPIWTPTLKEQHIQWGDIIPAYHYPDIHASYPGMNVPAGNGWLANNCHEPSPPPTTTTTVPATTTTTTTPPPTTTTTTEPATTTTTEPATTTTTEPATTTTTEPPTTTTTTTTTEPATTTTTIPGTTTTTTTVHPVTTTTTVPGGGGSGTTTNPHVGPGTTVPGGGGSGGTTPGGGTVPGGASAHTGKFFAGSAPWVTLVGLIGLILLGLGIYLRRKARP